MALQEIRTKIKDNITDAAGEEVLGEIHSSLGIKTVKKVRTARVFRFEGINEQEAAVLAKKLLCEEIIQEWSLNKPLITDCNYLLGVAYKPGVMNPEAESLIKAARDLGITLQAADSSWEYAFYGNVSSQDVQTITEKLLVNATIQHAVKESPKTLRITGESKPTETIPIREMNETELMELSKDKLFLNLIEMRLIQKYFQKLGRDPTDCEVEILAQTWSEHCVHKTFRARIVVDGQEKEPFLKRLQRATREMNHPLVRSAFVDNSGVFGFYDGWAVCGKVETHNSPSAIEPYGGAATGSGGVFRDIMGTGQGARVIASTDIFCFAPPHTPWEDIPEGCLHPHYILRRVVAGVRDYGNRMGIPTNNGSLHFHPDFRAKPTVIVGAYGLIPEDRCQKGTPRPGDLVVTIGGKTGRDGIHGATFSSAAMTERTIDVNAQAVQIGHPIEEKRTGDALLEARDQNLIQALTDCGAGGFASAVGEMGENTGVQIALDRAPLKYTGLAPWEILLSESQERLVLAIAPENFEKFADICHSFNVEATILGEFTGDARFRATFDGEEVMNLEMSFLHEGLPQLRLEAKWTAPDFPTPDISVPETASEWQEVLDGVLGHLNVSSREPIIRLYDHGVQGTNALPPLGGVDLDAPNDSAVMTPLHGKPYGLVISHGLNPELNLIDPYYGSIWAAAEAVSNAVAAGANPQEIALIDNFIWPVPDKERLGALDLAVDACVDFSRTMGMPFISGKDSLSSTYQTRDGLIIRIPPVLCISAFGRIEDVKHTVSADFKRPGNKIVLIGSRNEKEMGGSVYYDFHNVLGKSVPQIELQQLKEIYHTIHGLIKKGTIQACHDISEGGLATTVAEMAFGGGFGARIDIPAGSRPDFYLFNETAGCFIVEVEQHQDLKKLFGDTPHQLIGETTNDDYLTAYHKDSSLFSVALKELKYKWQRPLKEVFGG